MWRSRAAWGLVAISAAGCALLTNLDNLHGIDDGGATDAQPTTDAEPDVAPPTTCKSATTACVEAAPSGWVGPFSLYDGPLSGLPSACPAPMVDVLDSHNGVADASAACTSCGCGVAAASCAPATVQFFSGAGCATQCGSDTNPVTCQFLPSCHTNVKGTAPLVTATVVSDGGAPSALPPLWQASELGCKEPQSALKQVDCAEGEVCAPVSPAAFEPKLCVLMQGDIACDGPPYANKRVYYTQFADARACSPCSGSLAGSPICADGGVVLAGLTCTPQKDFVPFGTCFDVSLTTGNTSYETVANPPKASSLTCTPAGGAPTGTVTETQPVTVCCSN